MPLPSQPKILQRVTANSLSKVVFPWPVSRMPSRPQSWMDTSSTSTRSEVLTEMPTRLFPNPLSVPPAIETKDWLVTWTRAVAVVEDEAWITAWDWRTRHVFDGNESG